MTKISNYNYHHKGNFDFGQLSNLLISKDYELSSGRIKDLYEQIKPEDFSLEKGGYSRNVISHTDDYWLGILRWDKGVKTPIHGHPEHAFFYVLEGELLCSNFRKDPLLVTDSRVLSKGEYCYSCGTKGRLDNSIHQISAQKPSISLHFYSEDPSKGECFGFTDPVT